MASCTLGQCCNCGAIGPVERHVEWIGGRGLTTLFWCVDRAPCIIRGERRLHLEKAARTIRKAAYRHCKRLELESAKPAGGNSRLRTVG